MSSFSAEPPYIPSTTATGGAAGAAAASPSSVYPASSSTPPSSTDPAPDPPATTTTTTMPTTGRIASDTVPIFQAVPTALPSSAAPEATGSALHNNNIIQYYSMRAGALVLALTSLLHAVGVADTLTPSALANALSSAMPHLLPKDASASASTSKVSPMSRRYTIAKVARALLALFEPAPNNQLEQTDQQATQGPRHSHTPRVAKETLAFLRDVGADSAVGKSLLDQDHTIVRLGEIVFCAALHSEVRNEWVAAVMSLQYHIQDTLAEALHRVVQGPHVPYPLPLAYAPSLNDGSESHDASSSGSADNSSRTPSSKAARQDSKIDTAVAPHDGMDSRYRTLNNVHVVVQEAYPRLALGKRTLEMSNMNALEEPAILKDSTVPNVLPIASDHVPKQFPSPTQAVPLDPEISQIRADNAELRERILNLEHDLRSKEVALATARKTQIKPALPNQSSEGKSNGFGEGTAPFFAGGIGGDNTLPSNDDIETLRAKAESADVLEANLKQATIRLEQSVQMRQRMEELEKQNASLRDSEQRMSKRLVYVETQLGASQGRATALLGLSDSMRTQTQQLHDQLHRLQDEKDDLQCKLESAYEEIRSLMSGAAPPIVDRNGFNPRAVSFAMERELGVVMSWEDIVECVKGVVQAMQEMDEEEGTPPTVPLSTRQPLLRDFLEVDEDMAANEHGGQSGDEFDFAADQRNIKELVLQGGRASSARADGTSVAAPKQPNSTGPMPRRRSSTPSLPTVPEHEEGFIEEHRPSASRGSHSNTPSISPSSPQATPGTGHTMNDISVVEKKSELVTRPGEEAHTAPVTQSQESNLVRSVIPGAVLPPVAVTGPSMVIEGSTGGSLQQALDLMANQLATQTAITNEKERECSELRHELSLLIKEVDSVITQRDADAAHEKKLLEEKERLVSHLEGCLRSCTAELSCARNEMSQKQEELSRVQVEVERLNSEKMKLDKEIEAFDKKLNELMREHEVSRRSQEFEIHRLQTQLSEVENVVVRNEYLKELVESARLERSAAEAARDEMMEASRLHSAKLDEIHRTAVEGVGEREFNLDMRVSKSRKSTRFGSMLRRLTHRDNVAEYDTTLVLRPVNREEVGVQRDAAVPDPSLVGST